MELQGSGVEGCSPMLPGAGRATEGMPPLLLLGIFSSDALESPCRGGYGVKAVRQRGGSERVKVEPGGDVGVVT